MAETAWLLPDSGTNDSSNGSGIPWTDPGDITADDNNPTISGATVLGSSPITVANVRLVKGGTVQGDNKAGGEVFVSETYTDYEYGGDGQLWGLDLNPADVNNTNFGFVVNSNQGDQYLKALDFDAAIPGISFITGIKVKVQTYKVYNGVSNYCPAVDAMWVKIYYNDDIEINAGGEVAGILLVGDYENEQVGKEYQYKVYDKGAFKGEYDEVANDPEFKVQINTIASNMPIQLGRNIDNLDPIPEELIDQSGDPFETEADEPFVVVVAGGAGLGSGSDADVNYDLIINAYYGGYDWLVTQDLEQLLTQDYEPLIITDGAPEGRPLYTGFISQWETNYGGDEAISANIMGYGWELNQVVLESAAETPLDLSTTEGEAGGTRMFGRAGSGNVAKLRQTFVAPNTGKLSKITVSGLEIGFIPKGGGGSNITLQLFAGTAHSGTVLGSATVYVAANDNGNFSSFEAFDFIFGDYIDVANGSTYSIVLSSSATPTNTSGALDVYALEYDGSYASGTLSTITNAGTVVDTGQDLAFSIELASGETNVSFASVDPSDIFRYAADFAASRGVHINYTIESIEDSGTEVTITFKTNTIAEVINKGLELLPADWYYYIDPATNTLYVKPRPVNVDHVFTLGKDINTLTIKRDMEALVNEAYFSGGGDPALFIKRTDQASLDTWRRGLTKLSDNRVTNEASAIILADSHVDRNKEPVYLITLTIPAKKYDIETILPGQLAAFRNTGNFIDDLELQIFEKTYRKTEATIVLGTLKPKVSKRIEDIKRNLDVLEQQNNPDTPG